MPILNWVNKDQAMQAINAVDYRLLNFNAGYGDANPSPKTAGTTKSGLTYLQFYLTIIAVIDLRTLEVRDGKLPARVLGLVVEWVELHQSELLEIWDTKVFKKIEPLV